MSRVDDALRRARQVQGGPAVPSGADGAGAPDESPWEWPETASDAPSESQGSEPPPALAPVSEPGTAPTEGSDTGSRPPLTAPLASVGRFVTSATHVVPLEQYRKLAAWIHHAQSERAIRVLMIASAVPGEGKTLTAINLALTLAESYERRVLLVDADFRRPSLHDSLGLPLAPGLANGLRSDDDRKMPITQVSARLSVLTAGPRSTDPMALLTSDRMRRVLTDASETFDWVLLDTPPVVLMPDAHLLAAMVDGALLVVAAEETRYPLVQQAVRIIGRERILGVVLNRATSNGASHAYASYRYYPYYGQ